MEQPLHLRDPAPDRNSALPVALIWRMRLLPVSETFIRKQAESLRRFVPFYAGRRRVPGLDIPAASSWTVNTGGLRGLASELDFLFRGPRPSTVRRLARQNPTVIHAHFGLDSSRAIPLARSLRVPLISTFHGYDATLHDQGLKQTRDGRFYLKNRTKLQQFGSHFVAVSQFIRRNLEAQGYPPERTSVQYIGVDLEEFPLAPPREPSSRVLFVGRLIEKKGCSLLIRAIELVQREIPDVELTVIGDGPQRQSLESQAAKSLRRYQFLGAQPSAAVRHHMQTSDVFCVPSIPAANGDSEGFGIVFLEAQATGLPVVSFASGGIPEAVSHGVTGFLAPSGNSPQLAACLARLLRDKPLREKFSRAARHYVETHFDLHQQTAKLEDLYCRVVEQAA